MDHVALLRGINVGTAKRVAMADLRAVATGLGHRDPATVLNSGTLVFDVAGPLGADAADVLRRAVADATGVDAELVLLSGAEVLSIAEANPLRRADRPAASLSVSFAQGPLGDVAAPDASDLAPEELVVAPHAVYQWLPDGVLASRVHAAWWRGLGVQVTARNDATVRRIVALLERRAGG